MYKLLSLFSNTDTFYTTLLQKQSSTWRQERICISCLACSPILILFFLYYAFTETEFNMETGEDMYKLLSLFSNTDTFYTSLLQKQSSTWRQERICISCLACSPILILFFYTTLLQKQSSTWRQERICISCLACSLILILFILRFYRNRVQHGDRRGYV